jgi:hypothetical protein
MLQSKVRETATMDEERQERVRYYTFAALVGALLLLNVTGIWKIVFGIDTAGASERNHTTIKKPDIAQTVLLNIRNAEKMK